jgi:oligopeptide transport system permease protein
MKTQNIPNIPAEKFRFATTEGRLHDLKLDTKPVSYFQDAFRRFCRNKSSVVAAIIILVLILYSIVVPLFCENTYTKALTDTDYLQYGKLRPKSQMFAWAGWDGCSKLSIANQSEYEYYNAIGLETGLNPIAGIKKTWEEDGKTYYSLKIDTYYNLGMRYMTVSPEQYQAIQDWQDETGIQVIYPAVDTSAFAVQSFKNDANRWYEIDKRGKPVVKNGSLVPLYISNTDDDYTSRLRIAGDDGSLSYASPAGSSTSPSWKIRVSQYNYFQYKYGFEPSFLFGTNAFGQDIFTRLAHGAQFSFLLAIFVSVINLFIGSIYGAIEGYYGGATDLIMERVSDVLGGIPFMVATALFQLHLAKHVGPVVSLMFAFVLTGWIGMAARVRMQFYRFKNSEYVLAARTLGAKDRRVMFKHIFPNSLGTIITGSILVIPGVIFSESSLTYLGIVNLDSSTMTSVGTMLGNAKDYLTTDPHIILFPALFIALLEISFNLFGNGLRDAFNPSLRGTED